jgi:hypothetical protein
MKNSHRIQVPAAIAAIALERYDTIRVIFQYKYINDGKLRRKYADYLITLSTKGKQYISRFLQLMKVTIFKDRNYPEIRDEFQRIGSMNLNKLLGSSVILELEVTDKDGVEYHNLKQVLPNLGVFKVYREFPLSLKFFDIAEPDGTIELIRVCDTKDSCKHKLSLVNDLIVSVR